MDKLTVVEKNKGHDDYGLTKDQDIAAGGIISFIASEFNPSKYIVGLSGAGGTGKTYTMNYIINKCIYSSSVIKCAAPTHKACRVLSESIGGKSVETIQSVFGFRMDMRLEDFNPAKPQFNPMAKAKLDNIKLLVIDECTMIPAKIITFICNKCKELGIKIIFTGDSYQLSPPGESRSIAFDRCFIVYNLVEIVRQAANNPITPLLQLLRYDIQHRTYRFLEFINKRLGEYNYNEIGEGYSILRPNGFNDNINQKFSDDQYTKNIDMYRIVGYTNTNVSDWNSYIRNNIILDANKNIITKNDLIMSYETIVDEFMDIVINNSEEYIINEITNFVDQDYQFKGFLVKFQLVHGGKITRPLFIIDHRDRFSIVQYHKVINSLIDNGRKATSGTRVKEWQKYYTFKKKYLLAANIIDKFGKILYDRDIDYGFSITSHKSQGSTYGTVFVDVNNMVYNKYGTPYADQDNLLRRLYVACSRPKKELVLSFGK